MEWLIVIVGIVAIGVPLFIINQRYWLNRRERMRDACQAMGLTLEGRASRLLW